MVDASPGADMPARGGYAPVPTEDGNKLAATAGTAALYSEPPPPPGWQELALPERDAEEDPEEQQSEQQPEGGASRAQILTAAPPQFHVWEYEEMSLSKLRQLAQESGIGGNFDELLASARPDRPKRTVAIKLAESNARLPINWHRVVWLPSGVVYYWDKESNAVQLEHPAAQYRRRTGFQLLAAGPRSVAVPVPAKGGEEAAEAAPRVVLHAETALSAMCTLGCTAFGYWLLYSFVAWVFG